MLFCSISVYDDRKRSKFINYGKFDLFAALTYPDADMEHLITGLMFFFWAFAVRLSYLVRCAWCSRVPTG